MTSVDILRGLGGVAPEFIAEAAPKARKKTKAWLKIASAVACVTVLATGTVLFLREREDKPRWPVETVNMATSTEITTEATYIETAHEKKWEEMGFAEKFWEFEFDGETYRALSGRLAPADDAIISEAQIGESLGSITLKGHDWYEDKWHQTSAEMFEIRNISTECAIALKFEGADVYLAYANRRYKPDSMADFVSDLNLREELSFGGAELNRVNEDGNRSKVEFEDFEDEKLWAALLSGSGEFIGDFWPDDEAVCLSISLKHGLLYQDRREMYIYSDGNLHTNIFGTIQGFKVDPEAAKEFIDWVLDEVPATEYVYVYETEKVQTKADHGSEETVTMTSQGYDPGESTTIATTMVGSTKKQGE